MKNLDWQLIFFVGVSLAQDIWIYYGLPRIYYYDVKQEFYNNGIDDDHDKKSL